MATSWSPISAKHVADGGVVRDIPLTTFPLGSTASSPSMDDESDNQTSIFPSSQPSASYKAQHIAIPDQQSQVVPPHLIPPAGINHMVAMPVATVHGHFSCSQCPRKFSSFAKASYHIQNFRHTHHCLVTGCRLSFEQVKDLLRHSETHKDPEQRTRYHCEVPGCNETTSRRDLLKRHIERHHSSGA